MLKVVSSPLDLSCEGPIRGMYTSLNGLIEGANVTFFVIEAVAHLISV